MEMDLCSIKDVKALLARHNFRFSKSMGQNFLIQSWVPERIARASGISKTWGVLEIGAGIGCLTVRLAEAAGEVVSVELDKALLPVLAETVGGLGNVEVVAGDILKTDISSLMRQKLNAMPLAVCANLPYNITTSVLTRLIDTGLFAHITVMVQREVAKRMCAEAGGPDYGAFTVYVKFHTEPEILFDVPPDCFLPQPKVYSAVVRLRKRKSPPANIADKVLFFKVVRAAFGQRRKTLANCLVSAFGDRLSKADAEGVLSACGLDRRIRGEVLDIEGFAAVTKEISAVFKKDEQKG